MIEEISIIDKIDNKIKVSSYENLLFCLDDRIFNSLKINKRYKVEVYGKKQKCIISILEELKSLDYYWLPNTYYDNYNNFNYYQIEPVFLLA